MTDKDMTEAQRFKKEAENLVYNHSGASDLWHSSYDTRSAIVNSVAIGALQEEVSGLREDMSKMQETFARIAAAMEEANAIKREENAPPKKAAGKLSKIEKK